MIAFTNTTGPQIWPSVDMVNIMSYDLMNRRNNVTMHHTSVVDSFNTVQAYRDIGLPGNKTNLGMAYYAKWFETDPNDEKECEDQPIGCKVVVMENADGSDNGKSGSLTFEKSVMSAPPANLKTSVDGTCGFDKGTKCPSGSCCSQYGNWYVTSAYPPCECLLIRGDLVEQPTTSAKQAVCLTTEHAKAFQSRIHGGARKRTPNWTMSWVESTTLMTRSMCSGHGIRQT